METTSDDMTPLAVAAERLGISVRHAQRLLHRVAAEDRGVGDNGAATVKWSVFSQMVGPRRHVADTDRHDAHVADPRVAVLEAEVARLQTEVADLKAEKGRLYDIVTDMAATRKQEVERARPLLLGHDAPAQPHVPFWKSWWPRG